jgi:hypothetical protein
MAKKKRKTLLDNLRDGSVARENQRNNHEAFSKSYFGKLQSMGYKWFMNINDFKV